jgi:3-oxoacyl-[acyl-carrier-protein] synthase III
VENISIRGTGSLVPKRAVHSAHFERTIDSTDECITARIGIKERWMTEPRQELSVAFDIGGACPGFIMDWR